MVTKAPLVGVCLYLTVRKLPMKTVGFACEPGSPASRRRHARPRAGAMASPDRSGHGCKSKVHGPKSKILLCGHCVSACDRRFEHDRARLGIERGRSGAVTDVRARISSDGRQDDRGLATDHRLFHKTRQSQRPCPGQGDRKDHERQAPDRCFYLVVFKYKESGKISADLLETCRSANGERCGGP